MSKFIGRKKMPKQNNAAEEDYLDNLLNSVLKNDGGEEIPDDNF